MLNAESKLATIWLYSRDPRKTGEFYRDVLGMRQIFHHGVYSFDGGGVRLSIHQIQKGKKVPTGECFLVFYVKEGIEEKYRKLKRRGVKFEG